MIEYTLISTKEELARKCEFLKNEKRVAVDLEADSMYHFKEKVCLVQIADSNTPFLIDPLSVNDLAPLKPVFEDHNITKVFHGADFDIRSLDRDFDIKINNLFDTEIACRFLGIQKRSLAALLKKHFNLSVDKSFQKTDWSRRPLSRDMINYSVTDVAYLVELSDILTKQLENRGRLEWAKEEFELQTRVRYENNGHDPLFFKFKGAGKMSRKNLAVLESLLNMRKSMAEEKDRPLFKVIGANAILRMTIEKPDSMVFLKNTGALSPRQMGMYGESCIKAILKGLEIKDEDLPVYPRKKAPELGPRVSERIKSLKEMRTLVSKKTGIEPGFLINNTMITAIASAAPRHREEFEKIKNFRNWQIEILEEPILNTLNQ
ncbi:MAG: HRDC domain-containing protein [Thermodesulfobacteriota bacterium]|nr:HRDC domain-containing protein [Thermodesulfobacteriota bacterium]